MAIMSSPRRYQAARKQVRPVNPNSSRIIRNISLIILLLSLGLLAWCKLNDPQTLPIRTVKINGNYPHVDKIAIQKTILPFLKNGLLNIDLEGLNKALQGLPWVDSVNTMRAWPDKLVVSIIEHSPVAKWNTIGLLDTNGVIFSPGSPVTEILPILHGPEGQQMFVWQHYQRFNAQLAPLALRIARVDLSARQAWELELSNGIKLILGRVNPASRLQQLVAAYPQVVGSHGDDIEHIDMRYTNGMAIKWKEPS